MKIFVSALLLLSFLSACETATMNHGMAADNMAESEASMDDGMGGSMAGG